MGWIARSLLINMLYKMVSQVFSIFTPNANRFVLKTCTAIVSMYIDDCSPGRGGMTQNGKTRGGIFHGQIDRCRENQGWTTACSGMPERDGRPRRGQPKASGLVLIRSPLLTIIATSPSGANLYPPGVWFADCHDVFLWCYVCYVLL